jgi:hypothetical protein
MRCSLGDCCWVGFGACWWGMAACCSCLAFMFRHVLFTVACSSKPAAAATHWGLLFGLAGLLEDSGVA